MAATDLFTVEVWSRFGLTPYYVLFFIEQSSRRVDIAGIALQPHGGWIKQIARNATDPIDGFLLGIRYLIMDRDTIFSADFRNYLKQEGIKAVRLPPRSPNLNAYADGSFTMHNKLRTIVSNARIAGPAHQTAVSTK